MAEARLTPDDQKVLLDGIGKSNIVIVQSWGNLILAVSACCYTPFTKNACPNCNKNILDIKGNPSRMLPTAAPVLVLKNDDTAQERVSKFRTTLAAVLNIPVSDIQLTVLFD